MHESRDLGPGLRLFLLYENASLEGLPMPAPQDLHELAANDLRKHEFGGEIEDDADPRHRAVAKTDGVFRIDRLPESGLMRLAITVDVPSRNRKVFADSLEPDVIDERGPRETSAFRIGADNRENTP